MELSWVPPKESHVSSASEGSNFLLAQLLRLFTSIAGPHYRQVSAGAPNPRKPTSAASWLRQGSYIVVLALQMLPDLEIWLVLVPIHRLVIVSHWSGSYHGDGVALRTMKVGVPAVGTGQGGDE